MSFLEKTGKAVLKIFKVAVAAAFLTATTSVLGYFLWNLFLAGLWRPMPFWFFVAVELPIFFLLLALSEFSRAT